ncbi:hypothetical protein HZA99_03725 [Candidatus Woesearchaeota archaeon]|nr:hypothetical protein [Candidatus Woesearchaeota archaeon]
MTDISILIHNFAIQLATLLFGISAGLVVGWFSAEELSLYQKQLGFLSLFLFAATFALPLLLIEKWIPFAVTGGSYAILALLQKQREWFFFIAPLVLFLATENKTAFFLCTVLVFAATGVMTLRILASFVKEKRLVFNKELFKTIFSAYWQFVVVTMIAYGVVYFV